MTVTEQDVTRALHAVADSDHMVQIITERLNRQSGHADLVVDIQVIEDGSLEIHSFFLDDVDAVLGTKIQLEEWVNQ